MSGLSRAAIDALVQLQREYPGAQMDRFGRTTLPEPLMIQIPAKCQRCGDNEVAAVSERFDEFVCSNCDEHATCGTLFESIEAWAERTAAGRAFEYEVK